MGLVLLLQMAVTVIANLACTGEGCLLLLRSGLLPKTEQQMHQLLQRKEGTRTAALLRPLIHLAAQPEGQKQILRSTSAPGVGPLPYSLLICCSSGMSLHVRIRVQGVLIDSQNCCLLCC